MQPTDPPSLDAPPLRTVLRAGTRAAHDRVDALYGGLDVAVRGDYIRFLAAHAAALTVIEAAICRNAPSSGCPLTLSALAAADLRRLGAAVPRFDRAPPVCGNPNGLIYVIAGAHLGNGVMRKRWAASSDPAVRSAGAYLRDSAMKTYWPDFLAGLEDDSGSRGDPAALVAGAVAAFAVFEAAFHATTADRSQAENV